MNRKLLTAFTFLVLAVLILSTVIVWQGTRYYEQEKRQQESGEKVQVVASIFPWYDLAQQIGGDRVETSLLVGPEFQASAFRPSQVDISAIRQADLFLYTSEEMEPWADDVLPDYLDERGVALAADLDRLKLDLINENDRDWDKDDRRISDPYVWLDPVLMKNIARQVTWELVKKDPLGLKFYQANLEKYLNNLNELNDSYREVLVRCQKRHLVHVSDSSFAYLAKRYRLNDLALMRSTEDLASLLRVVDSEGNEYVYGDDLVNDNLIKDLVAGAELELLPLHSLANINQTDFDLGLSYQDLMLKNLEQLSKGLSCLK